jgi:hypothetical protein
MGVKGNLSLTKIFYSPSTRMERNLSATKKQFRSLDVPLYASFTLKGTESEDIKQIQVVQVRLQLTSPVNSLCF